MRQALRGRRAAVEVAEAAGAVAVRMVSGRPAQRVGEGLVLQRPVGGGHGAMGRAQGRAPGMRSDRARQVAQVVAGFGHDGGGGARAAGGMLDPAVVVRRQVGQHFGAGVGAVGAHRLPAGVRVFEIVEVLVAVYALERLAAVVGRAVHRHAARGQHGAQRLGAGRHVGGRADAAQPHELLGHMQ
ncbi:Uncharacterised protein [Bordetella pertussis]|nr:Uncharacterised protein [Bordetella pertussis]